MQLLDLQQQTYDATQPDGVLSHDRYFPSSLSMHDFLLAAMIVYMLTMKMLHAESGGSALAPADQNLKSDMIAALKVSCRIWHLSLSKYPEIRCAADVLDVMMRKIGEASTSSSDGSGVSSIESWDLDMQTEPDVDNNSPTESSSQDPIAANQIFSLAPFLPPTQTSTQTSTSNFWTPDTNPENNTLAFDFDFPNTNPNTPPSWGHLMNIPIDFDWVS
ncbi:hypothetical protein EYC80_007885 [Monilinia laxa]|uniref:Transcription factor domain-containing protein n=1 Tax=Monilinia laxa TaxID=61186 RepID=A0A5N6JST7_MONLA|nr:hypothetical protein EYC80_007885 [Monilinia laxa]